MKELRKSLSCIVMSCCLVFCLVDSNSQTDNKQYLRQYINEDVLDCWEEAPCDDLISKTENIRLQAWRSCHLRDLEDRIIPTKDRYFSVIQPPVPPSNHSLTQRQPRQRTFSPIDAYKRSGKRLSYPLPGWMDELESRNRKSPQSARTSR